MQRSERQRVLVGEYKSLIYDVLCFAFFCGLTVTVYTVYAREVMSALLWCSCVYRFRCRLPV